MASTIIETTDGIKPPDEAEFGPAGTVVLLLDNGQLEIPPIRTLGEFRQWAHSDGFPEHVRIDYIAGLIEVDMSPQDLYCHGTVNGEIYAALYQRVKKNDRGQIFINQTRLSSDEAGLSAEPDILFVSYESFESGKVQHVPKANDDERYVELRGGADLVVETISDGSVRKDTVQLPDKYYRANVTEFWLIDARGDDLQFQIYRRGSIAYEATQVDAEGYQYSSVMECWYRLTRYRDRIRKWAYDLKEKPNS
jgi:Uma2 family endonuclease